MTLGDSTVQGFVLTFAESAILSLLDELEDYNPSRTPEQNEYNRQQIQIYDPTGQALGFAWVYLMTLEQIQRLGGVLNPGGWWNGCVERIRDEG